MLRVSASEPPCQAAFEFSTRDCKQSVGVCCHVSAHVDSKGSKGGRVTAEKPRIYLSDLGPLTSVLGLGSLPHFVCGWQSVALLLLAVVCKHCILTCSARMLHSSDWDMPNFPFLCLTMPRFETTLLLCLV